MVYKKIFSLSMPLMAAEISYISMSFVDAILMGLLGVAPLAGGGLGVSVLHLLTISAIGVVASVGNIVAVSYGAKRDDEITSAIQGGLIASLLLAVIILLCVLSLEFFFALLNIPAGQAQFALEYIHFATPSVLALLIFRVFRGFATALHYTGIVFKISLFGALLNFPISYSLMVGKFGLPSLGLAGIGLGTSIVCWAMVLSILIELCRKKSFERYRFWKRRRASSENIARVIAPIFQLGCPIALAYGLEAGLYTATTFLVSTLGDVSLAVHHVVLRCTSVTFRLPAAIAQASSVLVGRHYGEGDISSVKLVTHAAMVVGIAVSTISSVLYIFFPERIIELFLLESDAAFDSFLTIAVPLLILVGATQFIASLQVIVMGILRGLKQTIGPTAVTAFGYWMIGFPSAYLLVNLTELGVVGAWAGLGLGVVVTLVLLFKQYINVQNTLYQYA